MLFAVLILAVYGAAAGAIARAIFDAPEWVGTIVLMAGIAGVMSLAFFHTTTIAGHSYDNLNVITAVVMGGTSLFGGRGTVVGTVIGVFIPAVLNSGLVILGVQTYWQSVAVGAVLIAAVYVDQIRRRSRERG